MALPLIRYWVEIQLPEGPVQTRYFGVTAYSLDDALSLLRACAAYGRLTTPMVVLARPNVNVSGLDAAHVLPNMLPPNRRGVWFPIT